MKNIIKNISNRPLPVDGTNKTLKPQESMEVEITERLKYMIQNHFFEDLGDVSEKPKVDENKTKEDEKKVEESEKESPEELNV